VHALLGHQCLTNATIYTRYTRVVITELRSMTFLLRFNVLSVASVHDAQSAARSARYGGAETVAS
jgi:hypothetical protein